MNKKDIYTQIIEKIKENEISTTEIGDCLNKDKNCLLKDVKSLNRGHFRVGRVFLAYAYNESNWELHEQIQSVQKGDVLLVKTHNCQERAIFGDLVSKYLTLYKGAVAVVVDGNMRDARRLIKENRPIWCKGVTPIGCFNKKNEAELNPEIVNAWKKKYEGTTAVCDDGGVVIIPPEFINDEFLEKLDFIELQEDIWYHCIDTKKWSTYKTVCLKEYRNHPDLLPSELKEKFEEFVKKSDNSKNR